MWAATWLSYGVAWAIGVPLVVPLLNTAAGFPFLYRELRAQRPGRAIELMLLWAAAMAVAATLLSWGHPDATARLFLHAPTYRAEMFTWVRTGIGAESDPARFVPQQLGHAALFCALSLLSGGLLSMPMGAVLMNYMGHYVGTLAAESAHPLATVGLAWPPWALVRIVSFVILGVVLAGPLLARVGRFPYRLRSEWRWLVAAFAGLVLDLVMKGQLAPQWQIWLKRVVGW